MVPPPYIVSLDFNIRILKVFPYNKYRRMKEREVPVNTRIKICFKPLSGHMPGVAGSIPCRRHAEGSQRMFHSLPLPPSL